MRPALARILVVALGLIGPGCRSGDAPWLEFNDAGAVDDAGSVDAGAADAGDAGPCPSGMALIPGGTFTNFRPSAAGHNVTLSPFCMDLTEVTAQAYASCPTCAPRGSDEGCATTGLSPANCVTSEKGAEYCKSLGRRLPSADEWQFAARGNGGPHPWGAALPTDALLCWSGTAARTTPCEVGQFPGGDSPQGIHDLVGNVDEWVTSYLAGYYAYAGGDHTSTALSEVRWNSMTSFFTSVPHPWVGFRCVTTPN